MKILDVDASSANLLCEMMDLHNRFSSNSYYPSLKQIYIAAEATYEFFDEFRWWSKRGGKKKDGKVHRSRKGESIVCAKETQRFKSLGKRTS